LSAEQLIFHRNGFFVHLHGPFGLRHPGTPLCPFLAELNPFFVFLRVFFSSILAISTYFFLPFLAPPSLQILPLLYNLAVGTALSPS
jgi:hypothetical protein